MENQTVQLVELSLEMETQFMEFRSALASEDSQNTWLFEYKGESFDILVDKLQDQKQGKQLPEGWVPCSTFFLIGEGGKFFGKSSLRHELNDHLRTIGGHIGYIIRKSERRKGYGTKILRLTLDKACEVGLKRVLITCDEDNIASAKIIEKNGGILENTFQNKDMAAPKRRYWIEL